MKEGEQMKTIVVIPTYDERDNVRKMAEAVLGLAIEQSNNLNNRRIELLFVDDNSPDGTGDVIEEMMKTEPRIHCLHRVKKEGLGRAYVAGFAKAIELGADLVIQMDCDFSHDPKDIPRMIEAATGANGQDARSTEHSADGANGQDARSTTGGADGANGQDARSTEHGAADCGTGVSPVQSGADLVIGSRYVPGGDTPGWPFKRRFISRAGGVFIRLVTGMPLRDPTGGFKCWRVSTLKKIDFTTVGSKGYSFQLEMNHRTWKAGCAIREIPIVFTDRVAGYSKITPGIATESIKIALKLRFGK